MSYDNEWITKQLTNTPGADTVKVKVSDDVRESKTVDVPTHLWRTMMAQVRDADAPKPLPVTFGGHDIVMTARIQPRRGEAPHQAVVLAQQSKELFTVSYLIAQHGHEPWEGWQGDYDLSRSDAFNEFLRRCS